MPELGLESVRAVKSILVSGGAPLILWYYSHDTMWHPDVHSWGVSRERVCGWAVGVSDMWLVTSDTRHRTSDIWHKIPDTCRIFLNKKICDTLKAHYCDLPLLRYGHQLSCNIINIKQWHYFGHINNVNQFGGFTLGVGPIVPALNCGFLANCLFVHSRDGARDNVHPAVCSVKFAV